MRCYHQIQNMLRVILAVVSCWLLLSAQVKAAEPDRVLSTLPLEPVSATEREEIWSRLALTPIAEPTGIPLIKSIGASEGVGIVLLSTQHDLFLLDDGGTLRLGFHFDTPGTAGLCVAENHILVFLTRGQLVVVLTKDGSLAQLYRLTELNYETQKRWNELAFREEAETGSGHLELRNQGDGPAFFQEEHTYTKLVLTDAETGAEKLLFDVSAQAAQARWMKMLLGFLSVVITLSVGLHKRKSSG